MARRSYPHVVVERGRQGERIHYVRVGHGPRIRLWAPFGSQEFEREYVAILGGGTSPYRPGNLARKPAQGTLAWLVDQYRRSSYWSELKPATRRQRENILRHVLDRAGHEPYDAITRKVIQAGRDARADRPSAANNFLNTLRALFAWAIDAGHLVENPAADVKGVRRPDNGGFHTWTEGEIAQFEARYPVGTRERVAFGVLLYTGLRRGDAVMLGRQHVRNGAFSIKTEKTGTAVDFVLLPELRAILDAGPCGDLAFIAGENGRPMTKESFGNWFRAACGAAGVPGTAHGLRKAAAVRLAEAGASERQLMAVFGWSQSEMAQLYTRAASRKKLAVEAAALLRPGDKNSVLKD